MKIPFVKTREEREFETRLKYRRIVRGLQSHLQKLEKSRDRFRGLLRMSLETGIEVAIQRNARACAALGKRLERVQAQVLAVEGIDAIHEMVRIDREFCVFARDMGRAMTAAVGQANIARFQADLERGMMQAEEMDDLLNDVIGSLSEQFESFGVETAEGEVDAAVRDVIGEAQAEKEQDKELEARIAAEISKIKETVGKS